MELFISIIFLFLLIIVHFIYLSTCLLAQQKRTFSFLLSLYNYCIFLVYNYFVEPGSYYGGTSTIFFLLIACCDNHVLRNDFDSIGR